MFAFTNINAQTSEVSENNSTPEWVNKDEKPKGKIFYDVQKAFNEYFETHDNGKGSGWKQFKRWEWFMEQRVFPSGERIPHAQLWNEIQKFNAKYTDNDKGDRSNWEAMGPSTSWRRLPVTGTRA